MYLILNSIMSIFEWIILGSFPLILLGYHFRQYFNRVIGIATLMSLFSLLLHSTTIHLSITIALQIILFFLFIKKWLHKNMIETVVISTIGYGFYILVQFLLIEITIVLSTYSYFEVILPTHIISLVVQAITVVIGASTCYLLHSNHYHLNELRDQITAQQIPEKIKVIIYASSVLTFVFISLAAFVMLAENLAFKNALILLCIIVLMLILSFYHLLYTQFQTKRLIEAKKFYLDQDQQFISMVEKIKEDSQNHFKALLKLSDKGATELIRSYIEKEKLTTEFTPNMLSTNGFSHSGEPLDELMYAFLINKRKLARVFDIQMVISSDVASDIPITFQQIKNLNKMINYLIFSLYQWNNGVEKTIDFGVITRTNRIEFHIASPLQINGQKGTDLHLINSLNEFNKDNMSISSKLNPFNIVITITYAG